MQHAELPGGETPHNGMTSIFRYDPPSEDTAGTWKLIANNGQADEEGFVFVNSIEIGRDDGVDGGSEKLFVAEATISRRHCVIARQSDGRYYIRDFSSNGTRLDGRRLLPNVETEVLPGQVVAIADDINFVIEGTPHIADTCCSEEACMVTTVRSNSSLATIVVGDIRDFAALVQRTASSDLRDSIHDVFDTLNSAISRLGGTVKEYQGDAVVAFWEGDASASHVKNACSAALKLDEIAKDIAADGSVWRIPDFELRMDWALATGEVMIEPVGGDQPSGLSIIGEAAVLAFRLEKFANNETGNILACPTTRALARSHFDFCDLGLMQAKGFERPDSVFALTGARSLGDPHDPDQTLPG